MERFDAKVDRRKKRLREPLDIDEKVLVLAERLRKKEAPVRLYKSTIENKTFFSRDKIFYNISKVKTKQRHLRKWTKNKR